MMTGLDVKSQLVRIFKTEMAARTIQMQVITKDPLTQVELPCIAVNQIVGTEGQMGFNNYLVEEYNAALGQDTTRYAGLITETFEVRLWTENANERDFVGRTMLEIALLAKQQLIMMGLGNMSISGMRDEQDYKTFEPYAIHWKVLNFTCLNQYNVTPLVPVSVKPITGVTVQVDKIT